MYLSLHNIILTMIGSNHELNYYWNKEHGFETMIFMGYFRIITFLVSLC